jgi:VIT1/CCC1 family predicted Fe2+/Mn2+ transporter
MTTPKTFGFQIEGDRRQKTEDLESEDLESEDLESEDLESEDLESEDLESEDRRQKMKKLPLHVAGTCSPSLSLEHSVPSSDQLLIPLPPI